MSGPSHVITAECLHSVCLKKILVSYLQTEKLYKKGHNDLDNHDGVVSHLEPDILECELKWSLGSITMNTVSGGDGIPAELNKNPKR